MIKILEIKKSGGQWCYRVLEVIDGQALLSVDWQFGPHDKSSCLEQAQDRFGLFQTVLFLS